jgi:UDP-glucose 4-epimerase
MAVLDAVRASRTPRMIFSSTGSIYVSEGMGKHAEEAPVRPLNPYSVSKLMVDQMLAAECTAFGWALRACGTSTPRARSGVSASGTRRRPTSSLSFAIRPGRHEVYNLGNGDGYSNRQVIEAAREVTGRPVPVTLAPRRVGDPAATVAASDQARRELGWQPAKPDLREIIADAWAFHQATW